MDVNVQALLKVARHWAIKRFGNEPNLEERIADVQDVAWELSLTAPENATLSQIVQFAARRVATRRQFRESIRSVDTLPKGKQASRNLFRRVPFDPKLFASLRDNPAEVATFQIDYPAWIATLTPLKRQALEMLAVGEQPSTVAMRLEISPGRVAQIRRELAENWQEVHS